MNESGQTRSPPGFFRRLGALVYDALLLFGVLFAATFLILPFNAGEPFSRDQYFYPLYLLTVSFFFYGWFWTHGGQTLGMRAWRIRVRSTAGQALDWKQALLRFFAALLSWSFFGLGFLWILLDRRKRSWHDLLSKSEINWQNDGR